jgi:hypothetical protein
MTRFEKNVDIMLIAMGGIFVLVGLILATTIGSYVWLFFIPVGTWTGLGATGNYIGRLKGYWADELNWARLLLVGGPISLIVALSLKSRT